MDRLGIAWTVGLPSGGGVYALNLALTLPRKGVQPMLLNVAKGLDIDPLRARVLRPALKVHAGLRESLAANTGRRLAFPVLQPMGDRLMPYPSFRDTPGHPDIGLLFFEHADIPPKALALAGRLPLIIAGSSWNAQVLAERGVRNVACCPQGIDPALFHTGPRAGLFPDRFVIFSGGKLEYRKGQDIVVAAFRAFRQRHPEALLVCGWANLWPESMAEMERSPHVEGVPEVTDGRLDLVSWLVRNGIPADAILDLGLVRNTRMPNILHECDLAVFPSRCEGGTNLPAMEAMACGLPTVLSRNTGHLDLVGDHVFVLDRQDPVATDAADQGRRDWGESSVEELLEAMEQAYADRDAAAARGRAAAAVMADWSWDRQVDRLLNAVRPVVASQARRGAGGGVAAGPGL